VRMLVQIFALTSINLRSMPQRLGSSAVAIAGFAGVVAVFIAVLSIGKGFEKVMTSGGKDDVAIVLRGGSDSELSSGLGLDQVKVIKEGTGALKDDAGAVASAELFVIVDVPKRSSGTDANVPLRGVELPAFEVRPEVKIVEGRRFEPGRREIIAGRAAAGQFAGLDVGNTLRWGENEWTVVGIFESGGSIAESEIWTDVRVLQPAYRRGSTFQSVYVRLESPAAFTEFKDALTEDPRLEVDVEREREYFAAQSQTLNQLVTYLGIPISILMAIGATFGALNTMYTAVSSRGREIATLRALGFQSIPVIVSVMVESLLLALAGGLVGGGLAYATVNGFETATLNWQTFSQVAFSLAVTPQLLQSGVVYAVIMGFFGGLFPAIRAARLPIPVALRGV